MISITERKNRLKAVEQALSDIYKEGLGISLDGLKYAKRYIDGDIMLNDIFKKFRQ